MNKILKVCLLILLFAVLVEFSPIIILVVMLLLIFGKGSGIKEKSTNLLDKTKRIIND